MFSLPADYIHKSVALASTFSPCSGEEQKRTSLLTYKMHTHYGSWAYYTYVCNRLHRNSISTRGQRSEVSITYKVHTFSNNASNWRVKLMNHDATLTTCSLFPSCPLTTSHHIATPSPVLFNCHIVPSIFLPYHITLYQAPPTTSLH